MSSPQLPKTYALTQLHQQQFHSLIEWPATTPEQAVYNEFVMKHADRLLPVVVVDQVVNVEGRYMHKVAFDVLSANLRMPREQRISDAYSNIVGYADPSHPAHPAQWLHSVKTAESNEERWFGPVDVLKEVAPGGQVVHWWKYMAQQCEITDLTQQVNEHAEDAGESLHTASIYAEDLELPPADDSDLEPVVPGSAS